MQHPDEGARPPPRAAAATQVVGPPRKLQAIGNRISWVATADPGSSAARNTPAPQRAAGRRSRPSRWPRPPRPRAGCDPDLGQRRCRRTPAHRFRREQCRGQRSGGRDGDRRPRPKYEAELRRRLAAGCDKCGFTGCGRRAVTGPKCEAADAQNSCIASRYLKVFGGS